MRIGIAERVPAGLRRQTDRDRRRELPRAGIGVRNLGETAIRIGVGRCVIAGVGARRYEAAGVAERRRRRRSRSAVVRIGQHDRCQLAGCVVVKHRRSVGEIGNGNLIRGRVVERDGTSERVGDLSQLVVAVPGVACRIVVRIDARGDLARAVEVDLVAVLVGQRVGVVGILDE